MAGRNHRRVLRSTKKLRTETESLSSVAKDGGSGPTESKDGRASSSSTKREEEDVRKTAKTGKTKRLEVRELGPVRHSFTPPGQFYEWAYYYVEYAALVRLTLEPVASVQSKLLLPDSLDGVTPRSKVKFYTRPAPGKPPKTVAFGTRVVQPTEDAFEKRLRKNLVLFPAEGDLPEELVKFVSDTKEVLNFFRLEYNQARGQGDEIGWVPQENNFPDNCFDSLTLWMAITVKSSLIQDMMNGHRMVQEISRKLRLCFKEDLRTIISFFETGTLEGMNSKIELLSRQDEQNFDRPFDVPQLWTCKGELPDMKDRDAIRNFDEQSIQAWPREAAKIMVPDFLWVTRSSRTEFGTFLLSVEVKPSSQYVLGLLQCTKSMLTKMHFQDHMFGLVVTPLKYAFLLHIMQEDGIVMCMYEKLLTKDSDPYQLFDVDSFGSMITMLGRIIMFGQRWYSSQG